MPTALALYLVVLTIKLNISSPKETNLIFFSVDKCEMVDGALVVSQYIAAACVLVSHVTSKLKVWIKLAHISWTEARLRNYNQHL